MQIKSHLFEIMQFGFLPDILLFRYLSVLLKPNFLKKMKEYLVFSRTVTYITHTHTHKLAHVKDLSAAGIFKKKRYHKNSN